ncbi:alpha/beta hydrolase family protein [Streptacidiphilus carbonis]|uniref:alpha/beta hydrolase family protein n=1 Tax=Streptacidiphilus carbonis TaxID=105422 RepID=UPI0005A78FA1|nr:S9 family peptidase [Streptacidiphilus carbonis]
MPDDSAADAAAAPTAFHDLGAFAALPRISSLTLSPAGDRLIASVAELAADGTRYITALWEVDPAGERPARRLTRSAKGESAPAFRPDGTLLFLSARPDTDPAKDEPAEEEAALWALPAGGGEAFRVLGRPGGVESVVTARQSDRTALTASLLPGAESAEADAELRKARKDAKVSAILHEEGEVRFWDHDLGPGLPHAFTLPEASAEAAPVDCGPVDRSEAQPALSPDGALLACTVQLTEDPDLHRSAVAVVDAATGKRLRLISAPDAEYLAPAFAADSRTLVCMRGTMSSFEESFDLTLWSLNATDEQDQGRDLLPDLDLWPGQGVPSPAGGAVFFAADERGHSPAFRLDTADGTVTRLTATGSYTHLSVSPDGGTLYALRAAVDAPPTPVRFDSSTADQQPVELPSPAPVGALPGSLTEVTTTAEDGTALRSWLVLPHTASAQEPAPLLLWVHGGPQGSWNAWTWRWNPWVAAAAGYAVLLPDPAMSTGYGQEMHRRGWQDWGGNPYRDVMALTDAALVRPDLDADRTAMMGGSFGGYMANWIATSTGRFKAIVTHASLWNLHAFAGTTDSPQYWRRGFGDPLKTTERYERSSPHLRAAEISTPMLVIHGDRDYRVPIGEALGLWTDLVRFGVPAKFLYYPDEGHWILKPNNAKLWYATVLAFLAHHVLGEEWRRPDLL